MKHVIAVAPYDYLEGMQHKMSAYKAWERIGGKTAPSHYPIRVFHRFAYRYEIPSMWNKSNKEARLRFVGAGAIKFDTFPDYARYEIIPLIWDCWPDKVEYVCTYFMKHKVRTAIFTSSQTADIIRKRFPQLNILTITEGIDTTIYNPGKELKDRSIDLLEFGRSNGKLFKTPLPKSVNHLYSKGGKLFATNDEFYSALQDTKITISVPRCDVQPEIAGDIETLTQRYWENMLSRIIMVGRAPRELKNLIGYDPVINLNYSHVSEQVIDILAHIEDYQSLVDKNLKAALSFGKWETRMEFINNQLKSLGYFV